MNQNDTPRRLLKTQELWAKYEDVAMHFNDLLIKLRTQSLAGIAAVSTLVGIFTKEGGADAATKWLIAAAIFSAMAFLWLAIIFLDLFYYNRLLLGAVDAVTDLEDETARDGPTAINLSTKIELKFEESFLKFPGRHQGVYLFYLIVWAVIIAGALFSACMYVRVMPQA